MCRIASLFLLHRLKGSMSGDARDFNMVKQAVIKFFFLRSKATKEIHGILTETLGRYAPSYATVQNGVAQLNVIFFYLWCASSWTTQNDHPGDYSSNSRANLGRPPDFDNTNRSATGHLTWADWIRVHHLWRFGHAEVLREVGPEKSERGSKTSTMPVVWATFGIFSASSSLSVFQRAKLSSRSITSAGATDGHFEGETPRGHEGDLVLARKCPSSPGTCNPE